MEFSRASSWQKLEDSYDLAIVGGGITGAGVARLAAFIGLRVVLFEARDFASGTSSRSTKLVHGGIRYLEQGHLGMVFESLRERRGLMLAAPHLVRPTPFLFPVFRGGALPAWKLRAGIFLYDALSLFRKPAGHSYLSATTLKSAEPSLTQTDLLGAPQYVDCATDDARLTIETIVDAHELGAVCLNWTHVTKATPATDRAMKHTLEVEDKLSGEVRSVSARAIVFAAGPWTDEVRGQVLKPAENQKWLRITKGVHIVFARTDLPIQHAISLAHPDDKRLVFAIPWGEHCYFGTTDTDTTETTDTLTVEKADVDYLMRAVHHYFPAQSLSTKSIVSTWAGLRPLIADGEAKSASSVSREHRLHVTSDGIVTIAGGKLTTYRSMAESVLQKLLPFFDGARTHSVAGLRSRPLPGGSDWPDAGVAAISATLDTNYPLTSRTHLAAMYGTRAPAVAAMNAADRITESTPDVVAQVDYAVLHESAARLVDVLERRTQLYYRAHGQALPQARQVAERMAQLLSWTSERTDSEIAGYEAVVARSRKFREGDSS